MRVVCYEGVCSLIAEVHRRRPISSIVLLCKMMPAGGQIDSSCSVTVKLDKDPLMLSSYLH